MMTKGVEDGMGDEQAVRQVPTGVMCYCCGHESFKDGGKVLCDYCFRWRLEDPKHQCSNPTAKLAQPSAPVESISDIQAFSLAHNDDLAARVESPPIVFCKCGSTNLAVNECPFCEPSMSAG